MVSGFWVELHPKSSGEECIFCHKMGRASHNSAGHPPNNDNDDYLDYKSSPRTKRAGPKGLRAESARAVTGRRCPHSGEGEDFLTGQPDFFTETAVTPERKVEKWFPRWEINRHAEG